MAKLHLTYPGPSSQLSGDLSLILTRLILHILIVALLLLLSLAGATLPYSSFTISTKALKYLYSQILI